MCCIYAGVFMSVWLMLGAAGTFYWPLKYRDSMEKADWEQVVRLAPLKILAGPLAYVLFYPI